MIIKPVRISEKPLMHYLFFLQKGKIMLVCYATLFFQTRIVIKKQYLASISLGVQFSNSANRLVFSISDFSLC